MSTTPTPDTDLLGFIRMREKEDRAQLDEYFASQAGGSRPATSTDTAPEPSPNGPPIPFNVSNTLITGCPICPQKDDISRAMPNPNLSRCGACKVVHYCSRAHQVADRPRHKIYCKRIKDSRSLFEQAQAALRSPDDAADLPPSFFGHMAEDTPDEDTWHYKGTKKYLEAGKDLVYELIRLNTKVAVELALELTLGLMKMCPKDHMGVRCVTPFCFIRLGRDQECYDFCKWWVTTGNNGGYDWQNPEASKEAMRGSNVLEPVDVFKRVRYFRHGVNNDNMPSISDLAHLVAVTLVKIRMRWGVRALRMAKVVTFQDHVTTNLVWNTANFRAGHEREEMVPLTEELEDQIAMLFCAAQQANKHFWPALLSPGDHLTVTPHIDRMGDEAEMQKTLQECYNAFMETESSVFLIKELLEMSDGA